MSANVSRKKQRVGMHGSGLPMPRDLGVGEHPASGSLQGKGRQGKRKKNENWWVKGQFEKVKETSRGKHRKRC